MSARLGFAPSTILLDAERLEQTDVEEFKPTLVEGGYDLGK